REEFIGLKAKLRPVVILEESVIHSLDHIENTSHRKKAEHLTKSSFLVVPCYSPSSPAKLTSFCPQLVAEIRRMSYPQFFCLPLPADFTTPGSIIRLDRAAWVFLGRGTKKYKFALQAEIFEILKQQYLYLIGLHEFDAYKAAKEI